MPWRNTTSSPTWDECPAPMVEAPPGRLTRIAARRTGTVAGVEAALADFLPAGSAREGDADDAGQDDGGSGQPRGEPALAQPPAPDERRQHDGELAGGHHVRHLREAEGEEDEEIGGQ